MSSSTLTQRHLNRALLARQGLLEPFADPLPRVLERVAGIQAQYAPSMYVGLWSRMRAFERDQLTGALGDRTVVQATLLRGTIHLVSRDDFWPFSTAVGDSVRDLLERSRRDGPAPEEVAKLAELLRAALAGGPLRQKEIDGLVGREVRGWVMSHMPLVRVPPSGTWDRRRADLFGLAEQWIGRAQVDPAEARSLIVRRYLGGFGPATPAEIGSWAGLPVRDVTEALSRIDHVEYAADDGTVLVDLPGAPLPDPDTPAPVRFLPTWDATLLVHARRTQILPEEHRSKIFSTRTPHSFPTFLVDGAVAGTWRYEDGRIELTELEPLPSATRRQVQRAAEALARFHS